MTEDVVKQVQGCEECQVDAPKQQKETLQQHSVPDKPWTKVGVDLFEYHNNHYLIITDYTTDYLEYEPLKNESSGEVIDKLKRCFARLGIPKLVQSDNGPQFMSMPFETFRKEWNFEHTTSSPHFPQSNGKAESAVKIVKRMLRRCADPELALLEYRNTPRENLIHSPIQEKRRVQQRQYNKSAKYLPKLQEGQAVLVRDYRNYRRNWRKSIIEHQLSDRSYALRAGDDLIRRNRRDIRPLVSPNQTDSDLSPNQINSDQADTDSQCNTASERNTTPQNRTETDNQTWRRSTRTRKSPAWHKDYVFE